MKKKVAVLLTAVLSLVLMTNVNAEGYSTSKKAEELTSENTSKITLSLPSDEEKLVSDVLFVIDSSTCSKDAWEKASEMMSALALQIAEKDGALKVGAVIFQGYANEIAFQYTTASNIDTVLDSIKTSGARIYTEADNSVDYKLKGSNLHAGLLKAKQMLDADTDVDSSRKYVVIISDGIVYTYDKDGVQTTVNYIIDYPQYGSNSAYEVHRDGCSWAPENGDWGTYLETNRDAINLLASTYETEYTRNNNNITLYEPKSEVFCTVDVALLRVYDAYNALKADYKTYIAPVVNNQYGYSFMTYLNGGKSADSVLSEISYDVYYAVSAGTEVTDVMGYGDDYDFDFVNEQDKIFVKVGDVTYNAERVEGSTTKYTFADGLYTLEYFEKDDLHANDYIVWTIGTYVSNFERVSLIYQAKLVEAPKTKGEFNLETNDEAIIIAVDSNGEASDPEEFEKPVVKYTNGQVTVKYVDEYGKTLSDDVVLIGKVGTNYTTKEIEVEGYALVEVKGDKTGEYTKEDIEVVYVYQFVMGQGDGEEIPDKPKTGIETSGVLSILLNSVLYVLVLLKNILA